MTRRRGRAPSGRKNAAPHPQGHDQTTTLISAIRLTRTKQAPWLFDGAMDGEMFLAWVGQGLVPALHKGDLVIMDNLATHKVGGSPSHRSGRPTLLYLPPYSPDFNPIQNMWSKIKQILRGLAPRTEERALLPAAKAAFQAASPADCRGFFLNARYAT